MAQTRTFVVTERGATTPGSMSLSVSAEDGRTTEVSILPGVTDREIDQDFVYTRLKGVLITGSGPTAGTEITVKTNSTGAPDDTLTFKVPGGIFYAVDAEGAAIGENPFTADVSRLYVTNPSTASALAFRISTVYDPTP